MRILFYLLNMAWGIPMNLIGAVAALGLRIVGKRPERHGDCWCFTVGEDWGGVSLGMVMIVAEGASERTKNHEHGHAVQNAIYGVFMPFIVAIPSAARYLYRRGKDPAALPPYDSVWFEGQATEWGTKYCEELIQP